MDTIDTDIILNNKDEINIAGLRFVLQINSIEVLQAIADANQLKQQQQQANVGEEFEKENHVPVHQFSHNDSLSTSKKQVKIRKSLIASKRNSLIRQGKRVSLVPIEETMESLPLVDSYATPMNGNNEPAPAVTVVTNTAITLDGISSPINDHQHQASMPESTQVSHNNESSPFGSHQLLRFSEKRFETLTSSCTPCEPPSISTDSTTHQVSVNSRQLQLTKEAICVESLSTSTFSITIANEENKKMENDEQEVKEPQTVGASKLKSVLKTPSVATATPMITTKSVRFNQFTVQKIIDHEQTNLDNEVTYISTKLLSDDDDDTQKAATSSSARVSKHIPTFFPSKKYLSQESEQISVHDAAASIEVSQQSEENDGQITLSCGTTLEPSTTSIFLTPVRKDPASIAPEVTQYFTPFEKTLYQPSNSNQVSTKGGRLSIVAGSNENEAKEDDHNSTYTITSSNIFDYAKSQITSTPERKEEEKGRSKQLDESLPPSVDSSFIDHLKQQPQNVSTDQKFETAPPASASSSPSVCATPVRTKVDVTEYYTPIGKTLGEMSTNLTVTDCKEVLEMPTLVRILDSNKKLGRTFSPKDEELAVNEKKSESKEHVNSYDHSSTIAANTLGELTTATLFRIIHDDNETEGKMSLSGSNSRCTEASECTSNTFASDEEVTIDEGRRILSPQADYVTNVDCGKCIIVPLNLLASLNFISFYRNQKDADSTIDTTRRLCEQRRFWRFAIV